MARMGGERETDRQTDTERDAQPTAVWWANPKERDNLEDLRVDGRIILKNIYTFYLYALRHENWKTDVLSRMAIHKLTLCQFLQACNLCLLLGPSVLAHYLSAIV